MKFFDSHIHLHTDSIDGWKSEKNWIFNNVSISLEDFHYSLKQFLDHPHVYLTAGIHPLEIDFHELSEAMMDLDAHISKHRKKIIAIGETGFDFYKVDRQNYLEKQRMWFFAHYDLAKKHNLPLMLHIRRAHPDALEFLESTVDWYGVIHSFDAEQEIAERYLNLPGNWMLSVSPVMLRDTCKLRDYIGNVDINRLLVESDAPFLGKSYEDVKSLIQVIADQKNMDFEECKEILWNNFCRFFRLDIQ